MAHARQHSADLQNQIERHTLDLSREPAVQAARDAGERALLAAIPDADPASKERYAEIAQEITLNALVGLADGYTGEDLPRLIMREPRRLGADEVPGNRGLHDNPDTFYRLIPLDGRSDFTLEGRVSDHPATIFELSALTAEWHTITNLTKADLGIAPGSRFRIDFATSDSKVTRSPADPSAAIVSHRVEIPPDAEMLLVRETLADWSLDKPSELTIENYVDRGGERTEDDARRIDAAAARVTKWFREAIRLTAAPLKQAPNAFPAPVISGEHGKLVTMAYSIGHFWVRPGEALVLTIDPGSADYVGVPITNLWGTTNRNLSTSASLNSLQAAPNHDGTFTCVLSLDDPGVQNWISPDGLERGFLFLRWAGLDANQSPAKAPGLSTQVTSVTSLRAVLPNETRWVDAQEREHTSSERRAAHALRFKEFSSE